MASVKSLTKGIHLKIIYFFFLIALSGIAVGQQPINTAGANDAFTKLLISQYQKYRQAGAKGDVQGYLGIRTADVAKEMNAVSSAKLQIYAKTDFNPAEYKFLRVESSSKSARALWEKKDNDIVIYQLVMFSLEGGEWKIGDILESINSGDMSKVPGPTGLEQLLRHRRAVLKD